MRFSSWCFLHSPNLECLEKMKLNVQVKNEISMIQTYISTKDSKFALNFNGSLSDKITEAQPYEYLNSAEESCS